MNICSPYSRDFAFAKRLCINSGGKLMNARDPAHAGLEREGFNKVKRGNLEWKLDFGTCCSRRFCSKSKTMFVWETHLSTVKVSRSCLTSVLHLECTADYLLQVQKLVGGVTWNSPCMACSIVHRNHVFFRR